MNAETKYIDSSVLLKLSVYRLNLVFLLLGVSAVTSLPACSDFVDLPPLRGVWITALTLPAGSLNWGEILTVRFSQAMTKLDLVTP